MEGGYKPLVMAIDDLVSIMKGFKGFEEGFYRVLIVCEESERALSVNEALVNFRWVPSNKTASYIWVVGRRDYRDVIKGGKMWEEVIRRIAEKNNVMFGTRTPYKNSFIQKTPFLGEDEQPTTEITNVINAQEALDDAVNNEVSRILKGIEFPENPKIRVR